MIFRNRIFSLLILLTVAFGFACPVKKTVIKKDLWGQTFSIKNKGASPLGVNVWMQDGTTVDANDMNAIDSGLTRLFTKARCHISPHDNLPYSRVLKYTDYTVALMKSTDVDSNGDPAIRIPPGQYAGTEYDKGGYILIAGQVLAIGVPYGNVMAIPDHNANFERESRAVEYEGEHIAAAENDPELYEATKTHGAGNGHPFLSDCQPSSEVVKPSLYAVGTYDTAEFGETLIFLTK